MSSLWVRYEFAKKVLPKEYPKKVIIEESHNKRNYTKEKLEKEKNEKKDEK